MNNLFFVDCEAEGGAPSVGRLTEVGCVHYISRDSFYLGPEQVNSHDSWAIFEAWLAAHYGGRPCFVSDNPAYDFQWVNFHFWRHLGRNPFGHSARRISDFYAGLRGDWTDTQSWKGLRITPHDHNPVNDAMGNVEAFERILNGEVGQRR